MNPGSIESLMVLVTQFGAAGLIGLLWVLERRAAAGRDRQLSEAHAKLMAQQREVDSLLQVVKENTAAAKALEYTQRRLIEYLDRSRNVSSSAA